MPKMWVEKKCLKPYLFLKCSSTENSSVRQEGEKRRGRGERRRREVTEVFMQESHSCQSHVNVVRCAVPNT